MENHRNQSPIERCPTGAIIWLDESGEIVKGRESKKIIRKGGPFNVSGSKFSKD